MTRESAVCLRSRVEAARAETLPATVSERSSGSTAIIIDQSVRVPLKRLHFGRPRGSRHSLESRLYDPECRAYRYLDLYRIPQDLGYT